MISWSLGQGDLLSWPSDPSEHTVLAVLRVVDGNDKNMRKDVLVHYQRLKQLNH